MRKPIDEVKGEIRFLKEHYQSLEGKVAKLEEKRVHESILRNKQERFSRRNNITIVNMKSSEREICIEIATKVFEEIGIPTCRIESAYRDHVEELWMEKKDISS